MKMFAWEQYRRDEESLVDAKKRFFRELPKATGGIRLLQLGCAQLLSEFHELCRANNLRYWTAFGTLLGAVRQEGFIPWDDDVDLGMPRNDLQRLIALVNGDPDSRYRVTIVYSRYVCCRQVRFWYRDESVPCFLDLFIYDWTNNVSHASDEELKSIRVTMVDQMKSDNRFAFWKDIPHLSSLDPRAEVVSEFFDRYIDLTREKGLVCDEEDATGIIWGVDNMEEGKQPRLSFESDMLFPLEEVPFEGKRFCAPREYEYMVISRYGDYLELPKDIHSHFQHMSHDALETDAVQDAIMGKLKK